MSSNAKSNFFDYLNEASQTVSNWPEWKKTGSDAVRLQNEPQKNSATKQSYSTPLILRKS